MELKGTKTEKNLMEAFAGESQARNKYTFFASMAKKEATSSWPRSLRRPPAMRRSTQRSGSSCCAAARSPIP